MQFSCTIKCLANFVQHYFDAICFNGRFAMNKSDDLKFIFTRTRFSILIRKVFDIIRQQDQQPIRGLISEYRDNCSLKYTDFF